MRDWLQFCKFVSLMLFDSCILVCYCIVYIWQMAWIRTWLRSNFPLDCVWLSWKSNLECVLSLISASRLKPVAYFYHMEQVTECCSMRASKVIRCNFLQKKYLIMLWLWGRLKDIKKILHNQSLAPDRIILKCIFTCIFVTYSFSLYIFRRTWACFQNSVSWWLK